jgi:hypothetical protein
MDENKITAAVAACIADALWAANPYRSINEFLATLKRNGWSEEERIAVQTQLLLQLKQRRKAFK